MSSDPKVARPTFGALRVLSDLISRAGLATAAGLTFGGVRDLWKEFGYKYTLQAGDYRSRYKRGGIAKRIVEAYPAATWRQFPELIEDEDPDKITEFEQAFLDMEERLQIWSALAAVDLLSGLGRYAILFIGAPGSPESPLGKVRAEEIVYLAPYAEDDALIDTVEDNPQNERYGLPNSYKLQRQVPGTKRVRSLTVHWSRVLHVADGAIDDKVYGNPRLEAVWNLIDDLEKVVGGGSEAFWQRVNAGLVFNVEKDADIDDTDIIATKDAAEELAHKIRRTMAVRHMEVTQLGSDVANFSNPADAIITQIAGTTGIPKRILVGSERGELASTQDRTEWGERVGERQEMQTAPKVIRPFIRIMTTCGALPEPEEGYDVRWPEMAKLDEKEQSAVATSLATLNTTAGERVITGDEIRDRILQLDKLDENDEDAQMLFRPDQLASATAILQQVVDGKLTPEGGVEMFMLMFSIPRDRVEELFEIAIPEEPEPDPNILPPGVDPLQIGTTPPQKLLPPGPDADDEEPPPTDARARVGAGARDRVRVDRIATNHEGKFRKSFRHAVLAAQEAVDLDRLILALQNLSLVHAEAAVGPAYPRFAETMEEEVQDDLLETVVASAQALARALKPPRRARRLRAAKVKIQFGKTNPRAVAWAKKRSAKLVTDVSSKTRSAIRNVITRAFTENMHPKSAAKLIKGLVGLTDAHADAVLNLRNAILAHPGGIVYVGARRIRVPELPSAGFIDDQTSRYTDRLLTHRSETIARTEALAASNEGQRELWLEAKDEGLLTENEVREWIVGPDPCPRCAEMDGQQAELDEPFVDDEGNDVMSAPLHPNCMCGQGLADRARPRAAKEKD